MLQTFLRKDVVAWIDKAQQDMQYHKRGHKAVMFELHSQEIKLNPIQCVWCFFRYSQHLYGLDRAAFVDLTLPPLLQTSHYLKWEKYLERWHVNFNRLRKMAVALNHNAARELSCGESITLTEEEFSLLFKQYK